MSSVILYTLLLVTYKVFSTDVDKDGDYQNVTFYNIDDAPNLFKKFIKEYEKVYNNETEYNYHLKIFIENLEYINRAIFESGQNLNKINECADTEMFDTGIPYLGKSVTFLINTPLFLYKKPQTNTAVAKQAIYPKTQYLILCKFRHVVLIYKVDIYSRRCSFALTFHINLY